MIDKDLYINGKRVHDAAYHLLRRSRDLSRRDLFFHPKRVRDSFGPKTVGPTASYFCMGDNRDNSNDSRFWGPVPSANLKGRAFMVYWSFDSEKASRSNGRATAASCGSSAAWRCNFFTRRGGSELSASCDKLPAQTISQRRRAMPRRKAERGEGNLGCILWVVLLASRL